MHTRNSWWPVGVIAAALTLAGPAAAASLSPTWVSSVNAGGFDLGEGVALAPDGSVYVAGVTETQAGQDAALVKLDADGRAIWTRVVDQGSKDRGEDVVADASGNAIMVSTIGSSVGDDVLVRKYSPAGEVVWSSVLDKGTSEAARAVALDGSGAVLLAGTSLTLHGSDAFVAKFSADGKELWSRPVNLYFVDEGFDVAAGPDDSVVLAGRVLRGSTFDLLVRKYDADGDLLWSRLLATEAAEEARGVAVAPDGTVFAFGTVRPAAQDSHSDAFLASFASDGATLATRAFDVGGADDEGRDIVVDASGNLILAGFCVCDGTKDPFVMKVTPEHEQLWSSTVRMGGIDGAGALAVAPDGNRLVIGGATQREGQDFDYFVAAYDQGRPIAFFRSVEEGLRAGQPVPFEDLSMPLLAPLASRSWDFGDGNTSSLAAPTHAYEYGGTYQVVLAVTDAFHNVDRYEKTVTVDGPARPVPVSVPVVPPGDDGVAPAGGSASAVGGGEEAPRDAPAPGVVLLALALVAATLVRRSLRRP